MGDTTVGHLDKVALITGGSMGIGAGCARVFVAAGARLLSARGVARSARRSRRDCPPRAGRVPASSPCDVTDPDDLRRRGRADRGACTAASIA